MNLPAPAQTILEEAAATHAVSVAEMLGRSRSIAVAKARRHAAKTLRQSGWSLHAIGSVLNRDHSTIAALLKPLPSAHRRTLITTNRAVVADVSRKLWAIGLGHLADRMAPTISLLDDLSRAAGDVEEEWP